MNVTDETGSCTPLCSTGSLCLHVTVERWNSVMTENQLDGTLNYGQFGYWKTETEPSNSFLQTPMLLPLSQFSDDSSLLLIRYSTEMLNDTQCNQRQTTASLMAYQLSGQQWHIVNDCQSDTPFGILRQLDDGRQYALRQLLHPNHLHISIQQMPLTTSYTPW